MWEGGINLPFPLSISGTPAGSMRSPPHCRWAQTRPDCRCPPWALRCSLGCWTSASSATRNSPKATGSWYFGGAGAGAGVWGAERRPATDSARFPARDRRPETCERPCQACRGCSAEVMGRDMQPSRAMPAGYAAGGALGNVARHRDLLHRAARITPNYNNDIHFNSAIWTMNVDSNVQLSVPHGSRYGDGAIDKSCRDPGDGVAQGRMIVIDIDISAQNAFFPQPPIPP